MSYPKPLSEKSLAKMYREAGLDEKKSDFLHKFFSACANFYGTIALRDAWELLKNIAEQYGADTIKRKDLIAFSSIARREDVPYYVYEIDELYTAEKRSNLDRQIVHKSLIRAGYGQRTDYYHVAERQYGKPYYLPEDLLAYAVPKTSPQEAKLLHFLSGLKVTASKSEDSLGRKHTCIHKGKTLGSFSFRNSDETFSYQWAAGEIEGHPSVNEKVLRELTERTAGSEAEKIVRQYREECNIGVQNPSDSICRIMDELNEVGVCLSEARCRALVDLLTEFNNESHLWCNCGWTPSDLSKRTGRTPPTSMSLGPGIMKLAAEGKIDLKEFEEELRKYGVKLEK
jgi:hypothetical protein